MTRRAALAILAVVLGGVPSSACVAQCAAGAGPCDKPHSGPGCGEVACCETVCAFDPVCCDSEWDEVCVEEAAELCAGIPCPMEGNCFEAHEGAGCEIEDCCFFTCEFDSFCCNANWDWICAEEAGRLCGARACTIPVPPNAIPEEELCGEHLNDGCSLSSTASVPIDCGTVIDGTCGTGSPRDTDWYTITLASPGRVVWSAEAEFPVQLLVLGGTCEGVLQLAAEAYGEPCASAAIDTCLDAGTWFLIVGPGYPERNLNRGVPC
ncbi:MAG: hypothetical protein KDA22_01540, partial [Phycisphaerales bacterium]|nr:hypothetical protein [Phycisphaerales bacterium]